MKVSRPGNWSPTSFEAIRLPIERHFPQSSIEPGSTKTTAPSSLTSTLESGNGRCVDSGQRFRHSASFQFTVLSKTCSESAVTISRRSIIDCYETEPFAIGNR